MALMVSFRGAINNGLCTFDLTGLTGPFPSFLGVVTLAGVVLCFSGMPFRGCFPRGATIFWRLFAGDDRRCVPCLPGSASAARNGVGESDPAGGGVSVLGSEPVLAGSAGGYALQRHCDCTFCAGCVSGDGGLAANIAGRILCRDLSGPCAECCAGPCREERSPTRTDLRHG